MSGVSEFRIPFDGDTYRCYQYVKFDEVIYVLDAGMKKSPRDGKIPNEDRKRLEGRIKLAKQAYEADVARLKAGYATRVASRPSVEDAHVPRRRG